MNNIKIQHVSFGNLGAEYVVSDAVLVRSTQDMLDLMSEVDASHIIMHDYNFEPDVFDLSTKKLGEVLQKCANYGVKLAVIGDFRIYPSKVLAQFIRESNTIGNYIFVLTTEAVKERWKDIA